MSEQAESEAVPTAGKAVSSVAGLGVDIVEIERIKRVLERSPRFRERVFTEGERAYCEAKHLPAVHYATHFAAKEAVLKALGTGFANGIGFTDVEVTHNDKGRPVPLLHRRAAQVAAEQGVLDLHLSLSRTHGTAVANAIAVTQGARPAPPQEKPSPKEELAAAFKEMRGLLDELDAPAAEGDAAEATSGEGAQPVAGEIAVQEPVAESATGADTLAAEGADNT